MTTEKSKVTDEAQIRRLIDDWTKALRAKDIDGLMSIHGWKQQGGDGFDARNKSGSNE
jgi:hypothetical protein